MDLPDASTPSETFDEATAIALVEEVPLRQFLPLLTKAHLASGPAQELARAAWTKAVLIGEWEHARTLGGLLPPELRKGAAEALVASKAEDLRFTSALFIMAWPGVRPSLDAGLGRQFLYLKGGASPLSVFDSYRDNWWCGSEGQPALRPEKDGKLVRVHVPGLSESDQAAAKDELALLEKVPSAQSWFGHVVLDFAEAHPADERVPYALHRVVWTNRSPKCPDPEGRALGKEAFQRLHKRYPSSEWAKKTPFYF